MSAGPGTVRSLLESLATPIFLHRLGSALFFYHCLLLLATISTISLYCLVYTPQPSSTSILLLFLVFHSCRSLTCLLLLILRACHPYLWHTQRLPNESWLASFGSVTRQYHHVHLLSRVCFLAWTVLGTVWYCEPERDGVERPPMLQLVAMALLVLEYAVVAMQAVGFVGLLWLFPYSQLSFALPFLPLPPTSLPPSLATQRGLTAKQVRTLPVSSYHSSRASSHGQNGEAEDLCAVCLGPLLEGELVRLLQCRHVFHQLCLDGWLARRAVCPLCVRTVAAAEKRTSTESVAETAVELSSVGGIVV